MILKFEAYDEEKIIRSVCGCNHTESGVIMVVAVVYMLCSDIKTQIQSHISRNVRGMAKYIQKLT